ncbi:membrane insertase OXA1 [Rhodotorula paludigena]|uniref:membrane insertase OXA1 n=1 Tax=Rhodotorula paludigena TaxID=86838 RepID=UPI0031794D99
MAAAAPARALRVALAQSARPAFPPFAQRAPLAAALFTPLRASPSSRLSPSAFSPAFTARRTFASTPAARGWMPGFLGGSSAPQKQDAPAEVESTSAAAAPSFAAEPVDATPVDAAAPAASSVAPAVEAAPAHAESVVQNVYDGIATGSLDLSSLAGSFGPHPIMRLQSLFLHLHESFPLLGHPGLQWALLIPVVTLFLRVLLFPFQVRAQSNAARLAIIQPEMLKGMNKLKDAKARGDFHAMQAAQMETQALMKKHDVNPIRNLVFPLAQATVFMCMFFALRGLANSGLLSMQTEGFGWVQDLSQPDPYYLLPVTSTALTLATLELGVDSSTQVQTTTTKNMKMLFRAMVLLALPFVAYFPAALLLYWTTNNFLSLAQSSFLKLPFARTLFGIPTPPPKPQPGDANYVPEPSFSEAFKNMQTGMAEKWEETQQQTQKQRELDARFRAAQAGGNHAEVYTPRRALRRPVSDGGVEQIAAELIETGQTHRPAVIQAETLGAHEAERNRRVAEARRRRLAKK